MCAVTSETPDRAAGRLPAAQSTASQHEVRTVPRCWALSLVSLAVLAGCGGPREIPGGTKGRILVRNGPALAQIQVTVYLDQATPPVTPLGLGVSGQDGVFELRQPGTLEAAWLERGDYRVTVESVGEYHLRWPSDYRDPLQTPLRLSVMEPDQEFVVEVPLAPE